MTKSTQQLRLRNSRSMKNQPDNSPIDRLATNVIVVVEGRWACRRRGIGQKGSKLFPVFFPISMYILIHLSRYHLLSFSSLQYSLLSGTTWSSLRRVRRTTQGWSRWQNSSSKLPISDLQAFLELVDRVLQSPGIWSPGQGLATVAPTQARPPILGWAMIATTFVEAQVSILRPQQRRTSSPPPCCGT